MVRTSRYSEVAIAVRRTVVCVSFFTIIIMLYIKIYKNVVVFRTGLLLLSVSFYSLLFSVFLATDHKLLAPWCLLYEAASEECNQPSNLPTNFSTVVKLCSVLASSSVSLVIVSAGVR